MVNRFYYTGILFLVLDQISKYFVRKTMPYIQWNMFGLEFVRNTGAAFGTFSGMNGLLGIVSLAVAVWLPLNYKKYCQNMHETYAYALIWSGAVGNGIDRLFIGYVTDFIAIGWWPRFNVADAAICIGAAILVYNEFKIRRQ